MKVQLWLIGKTHQPFVAEGMSEYTRRIARYVPYETLVLPDGKHSETQRTKAAEADEVLRRIAPEDFLVLLDARGGVFSSEQFAQQVERWLNMPQRRLIFLVGGAYGFDARVYTRGNTQLSLSSLTFSHQLIRLIFSEQLYRAFSILNNEPYHHAG